MRRSGGRIVEIGVNGHAGFAPRGRDIVCAGVSALVLSAAHGIAVHCGADSDVDDDPSGDYRLRIPRGGNARAQAVLESTVSGLRAIARTYPQSLRVRTVAGKRGGAPKRTARVPAATR